VSHLYVGDSLRVIVLSKYVIFMYYTYFATELQFQWDHSIKTNYSICKYIYDAYVLYIYMVNKRFICLYPHVDDHLV